MSHFDILTRSHLKLVNQPFFNAKYDRLWFTHSLRLVFWLLVLTLALAYQFLDPGFLLPKVWLPVLSILTILFLVNLVFITGFDRLQHKNWTHGALFCVDTVVIGCLVHFTGGTQSVFLFFFLLSVVLANLIMPRISGLLFALWTSLWLSFVFLFSDIELAGQVYFIAGINNVAIFGLAFLSGFVSHQIGLMGSQIRRQEADVKTLKNLNELIVHNIASGLLTFDNHGKILFSNGMSEKIMNLSHLSGRSIIEFLPDLWSRVNEVNFDQNSSVRLEIPYLSISGENILLEIFLSPLISLERESLGYLSLIRDITQLRRLEREIKQKEKLAAVGQLAAGIAHEIRNPLASISGSLQLMVASTEGLSGEDKQLMKIALKEMDRLNNLISEFLDFVRPEVIQSDALYVNQILKEVLEMVRFNSELRRDVEQVVVLKSGYFIQGNYDKLKQAFLNIIINAYHAMQTVDKAILSVSSEDVPGFVRIKIADTGIGMNDDLRERIFEPFLTTKPKGTGLGLAVTHKILESHGARVWVESQLGKGSAFFVEFPIEESSPLEGPASPLKKQA